MGLEKKLRVLISLLHNKEAVLTRMILHLQQWKKPYKVSQALLIKLYGCSDTSISHPHKSITLMSQMHHGNITHYSFFPSCSTFVSTQFNITQMQRTDSIFKQTNKSLLSFTVYFTFILEARLTIVKCFSLFFWVAVNSGRLSLFAVNVKKKVRFRAFLHKQHNPGCRTTARLHYAEFWKETPATGGAGRAESCTQR